MPAKGVTLKVKENTKFCELHQVSVLRNVNPFQCESNEESAEREDMSADEDLPESFVNVNVHRATMKNLPESSVDDEEVHVHETEIIRTRSTKEN